METWLVKTIKIGVILIGGFITSRALKIIIRKTTKKPRFSAQRVKTLSSLLINASNIAIFFLAVFFALSEAGIDLTPFLTGAGIIGLAIGLGMRDLASDLVAGFFMLLDNQVNVGDSVEVTGGKGRVVRVGIRNLVLKDKEGNRYIVPNSSIKTLKKLKAKK